MYEVKDKNKTIYFIKKVDADNYIDFLKNGLKVIRKSNTTFYFNNGDRLIDVSLKHDKTYFVLITSSGKHISSVKLQKKHIAAI